MHVSSLILNAIHTSSKNKVRIWYENELLKQQNFDHISTINQIWTLLTTKQQNLIVQWIRDAYMFSESHSSYSFSATPIQTSNEAILIVLFNPHFQSDFLKSMNVFRYINLN